MKMYADKDAAPLPVPPPPPVKLPLGPPTLLPPTRSSWFACGGNKIDVMAKKTSRHSRFVIPAKRRSTKVSAGERVPAGLPAGGLHELTR
jgi:hypothetical protein